MGVSVGRTRSRAPHFSLRHTRVASLTRTVPPDNHLAVPHVHVDHVWVAIAPEASPASEPAHPFAGYTAGDVERGLPMLEDSRALAPLLFARIIDMGETVATGEHVRARLASAAAG